MAKTGYLVCLRQALLVIKENERKKHLLWEAGKLLLSTSLTYFLTAIVQSVSVSYSEDIRTKLLITCTLTAVLPSKTSLTWHPFSSCRIHSTILGKCAIPGMFTPNCGHSFTIQNSTAMTVWSHCNNGSLLAPMSWLTQSKCVAILPWIKAKCCCYYSVLLEDK